MSNPPEEPPCDECQVELLSGNQDAASVYWACKNQLVLDAVGHIIDINYSSIKIVMDLFNIENQKETFNQVVKLFWYCEQQKIRPHL